MPHRAVIVGSGPELDKFRTLSPPDIMTLGHLEGEDLSAAYASSDIFFFPSHTETFGNVTLEAIPPGCRQSAQTHRAACHSPGITRPVTYIRRRMRRLSPSPSRSSMTVAMSRSDSDYCDDE